MEKLKLMVNIVNNFGVQIRAYGEPFSCLKEYDNGLRVRLFQTFDTARLIEFIRSIEPETMYLTKDLYDCHYCFFAINSRPVETGRIDSNVGGGNIVIVGPWVDTLPGNADIDNLLQKTGIPYHLKSELAHYYNHLPLISFRQCWEGLLLTLTGYLQTSEKKFNAVYLQFDPGDPSGEYSPKQDDSLSLRLIEKLYQDEDVFLEAIKAGDAGRALQCLGRFNQYQPPQRASQKIRNGKNYLLALNTLARKIVQNSSVHPMHIHTVSTDFSRRIEAAAQNGELNIIFETMIRRYCSLVQEYSLRKYSTVVRKIINTVEFNLKEPLSLNLLAGQFNIDPSNLSHRFTNETGMTLTDFINQKRLEHARRLISGTAMYVNEIAEECGYQDVNYFIRLFKRKYGKTPGKYRDAVKTPLA
ncbi:MAG: AraC family transcriptional regulator [Spirochaetaceae bacterium]|jgi:AraC-like DNA-binding protein|nr:AraC family transcriptional regulator [Spirochaetaceae bacterium]